MRAGEILLRALSREPDTPDYNHSEPGVPGTELSLLQREFPQFAQLINGKRVVDFGCGTGRQCVAIAREGACYVSGIDTHEAALLKAKQMAAESGLSSKVTFVERPTSAMLGTFDVAISQNAMEHFPDPVAVLNEMKSLIRANGVILITFGPPWFAPYGSHMHFFCKVPWLNILFSERTVMNVRAFYRSDNAKRYEEVESGLNKITIKRFENIVSKSGLVMQYKKYDCIKGQNWLAGLPLLRELFVNHVSCILTLS